MRELYEALKASDGRNYAKGHSFEEWLDHRQRTEHGKWDGCSRYVPVEGYPNVLTHRT